MSAARRTDRQLDALEDKIMSLEAETESAFCRTGFIRLRRAAKLIEDARELVRDELIAHRRSMGRDAIGRPASGGYVMPHEDATIINRAIARKIGRPA